MLRYAGIAGELRAFMLFLLLVGLSGCSGGQGINSAPLAGNPAYVTPVLPEVLAQLDDQVAPAGIDPAVFARLKAELRQQLATKQDSALAAAPPTGDRSRTQLIWDEKTATLTWYYFNNGDYDQNGEVSVSDLTPLGVNFGKAVESGASSVLDQLAGGPESAPFGLTAVEAVVDGDANGEIGISDITPIGQNFYRSVTSYRIYAGTEGTDYPASNETASTLTPLAEVALSQAQGTPATGRLTFNYTITDPQEGMSYWVRPVYGGAEGTPSNAAGAGLIYTPGSLALTGVSPASAEPGQLIWLEFNQPIEGQLAGLTLVVNGETDAEIEVGQLEVSGHAAGTGAPLSAPGQVSFEAFRDGTSIGAAQLTLLAPETELIADDFQQQFNSSLSVFSEIMTDLFDRLALDDPQYDTAAAEAELADFNSALGGAMEWFLEELASLSPEDQTAVLSYLENTGYFELLGGLAAQPPGASRLVSDTSKRNFDYLKIDMWSAAATNNAIVMDLVGLSITVLTSGGTVPALVAAKVVLSIVDNAIDTFVPTDLYDLRVNSGTRNLPSGTDLTFVVMGQFAAEKPAVSGTIELFVEAAMAGLKLKPLVKDAVLNEVLEDLSKRIGSKLVQQYWSVVLPVVLDPQDPCFGHFGGWWLAIDMHLYTSIDYQQLSSKVMYQDYFDWVSKYQDNPLPPQRVVKVEPDYGGITATYPYDQIRFSHPDKYIVTLRGFTFNDTESVLIFWAHTGLKEIIVEVPFWVGRFGDWISTPAVDDVIAGISFAAVFNDKPVCIYLNNVDQNWYLAYATDALGNSWSEPSCILETGAIAELAVINGLPAILYRDPIRWRLMFANNDTGTDWPSKGDVIPKSYRCSGAHTGPESGGMLVDDTATFQSSGVKSGDYVEVIGRDGYGKVFGVFGETTLEVHEQLAPFAPFKPGDAYTIYKNDTISNPCRLGVLEDVPMLIYHDDFMRSVSDTYFVSAKDWMGTEWNEPVLVGEDTGDLGPLRVVDGVPAYCTRNHSAGIYYRRATDPFGLTWGDRHLVADTPFLSDFEIIDNAPAICYKVRADVDKLYYTRAVFPDGSGWADPVLLASGRADINSGVLGATSLSSINGRPAVALHPCINDKFPYNRDLVYMEALDSVGYEWGEPVMVADEGNVIQLMQLGAGPAICYGRTGLPPGLSFARPDL